MDLVVLEGGTLHCQGHITERLHLRDRGIHMNLVALESGALHCQGHITERLHLRDRERYT
jgi:hypothetical protein